MAIHGKGNSWPLIYPLASEGLFGARPKAGGLSYLQRFATERTRTINTTTMGDDATLLADLSLPDET